MDTVLQNRFEGSIFFVYDRHFLKHEEDLLEDAIIYFYPHSMPVDMQCRLCGQLMGVVQFSETMFESCPALFRFQNEKIAVKHVGKYSFALAGSSVEPDSALLTTVDQLYFLFAFYHGSIDQVELECDNNREKFIPEIGVIFELYLAFIRNYGDNLPSVFNPLPYQPLKNDQNFYFLKASHILESCQRRPQVIAGAILYNRYILCSQLTDSISRCLLLLKPNQQHHPAVQIETEILSGSIVVLVSAVLKRTAVDRNSETETLDFQLPFGVRLFDVYLKKEDLREVLEYNHVNSPYQSQGDTLSSRDCCCAEHGTPRSRTPRMQPCRIAPDRIPTAKVGEFFPQSEKDPFSSSGDSAPRLCKAMLEDLLLKGFKCCKCIDETDGELENGSSCDNSIASECVEKSSKPKNGFIYPTEDIEQAREMGTHSRNSLHSRNSEDSRNNSRNSTVGPESGIEVTGSDFHSSAATHIDQRCTSFKNGHVCSRESSRSFQGKQEVEKCERGFETSQVKITDDGDKMSKTARKIGNNAEIVNKNTESIKVVNNFCESENKLEKKVNYATEIYKSDMLSKHVTSGDYEEIGKQADAKSFDGTGNERGNIPTEVQHELRRKTSVKVDANYSVERTKYGDENVDGILPERELAKELKEEYNDSETKQGNQICDNQLYHNVELSCVAPSESYEEQREPPDCSDLSPNSLICADDLPTDNLDTISNTSPSDKVGKFNKRPRKLHNRNLEVAYGLSKPNQYSSSEDSYRTADDVVDTSDSSEGSSEIDGVDSLDIEFLLDGGQGAGDRVRNEIDGHIVHVCKLEKDFGSLESTNEDCVEAGKDEKRRKKCCAVDGMVHANLFVQAHSEIALILLAKCDLYQSEQAVRSLWNTTLSQIGELDILMKNCAKENQQDPQMPFNLLIYDNFEKTMSGNLREPTYAPDHVFCETARTLHDHFNNAPQLSDVTLRNFLTGIYGERTLTREAYYQEPVNGATPGSLTRNVSGYLAERMRECIVKDHGLPYV